jgi:hypothetical protein
MGAGSYDRLSGPCRGGSGGIAEIDHFTVEYTESDEDLDILAKRFSIVLIVLQAADLAEPKDPRARGRAPLTHCASPGFERPGPAHTAQPGPIR